MSGSVLEKSLTPMGEILLKVCMDFFATSVGASESRIVEIKDIFAPAIAAIELSK